MSTDLLRREKTVTSVEEMCRTGSWTIHTLHTMIDPSGRELF